MTLQPGQTLLQYRIVDKLGEGGMGEVWKALDTTLDREVAIKVLPEVFSQDPERLARFEREAKLLASLNHPNIATVHGLHEADPSTGSGQGGLRLLAMEMADGEDLASRLSRGPLPVDEMLAVAVQVAAALEAAHSKGVVHRDLKPANVVLTHEGQAKVLDFGLAKAVEPDAASASGSLSLSPTMTSGGTVAGMILGTAAYMSPEQARGMPVDRRTDLWSFGCLMFECLTGEQLFRGETASDSMAAILSNEPDWTLLPEDTRATRASSCSWRSRIHAPTRSGWLPSRRLWRHNVVIVALRGFHGPWPQPRRCWPRTSRCAHRLRRSKAPTPAT